LISFFCSADNPRLDSISSNTASLNVLSLFALELAAAALRIVSVEGTLMAFDFRVASLLFSRARIRFFLADSVR
jgi:hypothetical protein